MALSVNENLDDLKALRRCQQSLINTARTDMENPGFFERAERDLLNKIAWLTTRLEAMQQRRGNGPEIIEAAEARLIDLNRQIKILENQRLIEQFLKLQNQMANM